MRTIFSVVWIVSTILLASGCQKEQLEKLTEQVKQATVEKLEAAVPPAPAKGQFRLTLDGNIQCDQGEISLIRFNDGRPQLLQVRSYTKGTEAYPAILFQGKTSATDPKQWIGQSVTGQLFIQTANTAPVWMSPDNQPVTLTITGMEGSEWIANITGPQMITADQKTSSVNGTCRLIITDSSSNAATSTSPTPQGVQ